ncbi:MAG: helicase-related protein [Actinomycetota bacterium]
MSQWSVGSIVRCREREWVVLPSSQEDLALLRPLTGSEREVCGIYLPLVERGLDRIEPASFPLPRAEDSNDAIGTELLFNAARLTLRDGAGPFRSLGRISVRPRPYQFVPLLMALRLDPVRLLIADDVGVGKTIEAGVIARELLDRGEIRRICVLCPPYLCDQWRRELEEKFHIYPRMVTAGTVSQLERELPPGEYSIFSYYQHLVVSIDYAKSERHKHNFLSHCPELVIVDEAHGAARPPGYQRAQQQRHELLRELAKHPQRHLILLTATPHSGVEESFLSLLALLDGRFSGYSLHSMRARERDLLARQFVQRRRKDVEKWMGEETAFPERVAEEATYDLSPTYGKLFDRVYEFSSEIVAKGETLSGWGRRMRFWMALAILRCVMSSPPAAEAVLEKRASGRAGEEISEEIAEEDFVLYIHEPTDTDPLDVQPTHIVAEGEKDLQESERRRLRSFVSLAREITKRGEDWKIAKCAEIVENLLAEGYRPIVWCRYIRTADYVASELGRRLSSRYPDLRTLSVTGSLSEEERRAKVEELSQYLNRVLVATDCLSEGINLQEHFDAVVHYDLPWNPNRLEQREGRVDRFGQRKKKVKAVLLYGRDNPVDGAVLDVLLRKARSIRKTLGIYVPVPMESETVMEAALKSLFSCRKRGDQLPLLLEEAEQEVSRLWAEAVEREKESRTIFAQRAIKPEVVQRQLEETDSVLGDPEAVKDFVLQALQRLGVEVKARRDGTYSLANLQGLPENARQELERRLPPGNAMRISFQDPPPEGAIFLGRNNPFVSALAGYLLEDSLASREDAIAARCGVVRTGVVERRTTLLLLRCRHIIHEPENGEMLAEQVLPMGFRGSPRTSMEWLEEDEALDLLRRAQPEMNVPRAERLEILQEVLGYWAALQKPLEGKIKGQAAKLREAHREVRASARLKRGGLRVIPQFPPDLLGLLVLVPIPRRWR